VGVDVDEPGGDGTSFGVDLVPAATVDTAALARFDGDDAVVRHGDVGNLGRRAGAVDHGAVPDHDVVRHEVVRCLSFADARRRASGHRSIAAPGPLGCRSVHTTP
jgi:hypothetical protein